MVQTTSRFARLIATAALVVCTIGCDRGQPGTVAPSTPAETAPVSAESPLPSKSDPPSPEAARANQLLESGEWRKALDAFYQLPPSREVLQKRAYAHTRLWEIQPAIRILREASDRYPEDIEISAYLASALTLNRELDEAIALYRQVLDKKPSDNNVRAGYALALAWSEDLGAAEQEYRRVLASDPRHYAARLGLGDVLAWQKRLDQAVGEYQLAAAATRDPRLKSDALGRSARSLAWKGDLAGALTRYEEALAVHPRNVEALLGRGEIHEWQREYGKAKATYEEVLRVSPEHPAAKAKLLQLMWVK